MGLGQLELAQASQSPQECDLGVSTDQNAMLWGNPILENNQDRDHGDDEVSEPKVLTVDSGFTGRKAGNVCAKYRVRRG